MTSASPLLLAVAPWLAALAALLACAVLAGLSAAAFLRMRAAYFSVATMGLALAAIDGACQPNHWPDGDTFHYKNSKGQVVKVRVAGFDAPERGQPFSKVARERLVALTEGGARCHCERKDGQVIRIISARKATRRESAFYRGT